MENINDSTRIAEQEMNRPCSKSVMHIANASTFTIKVLCNLSTKVDDRNMQSRVRQSRKHLAVKSMTEISSKNHEKTPTNSIQSKHFMNYCKFNPLNDKDISVKVTAMLLEKIRWNAVSNKLCGRPPQCPRPLQVDLLTLKVVPESRVTWAICANFSLPKPLCSGIRPDVRDRQSDVRQHHRLMHPPIRGGA